VWRDRTLDAVTLCTLGGVAALRLSATASASAAAAPHTALAHRTGRSRRRALVEAACNSCSS
jgi:hypothetical protein